MTQDIEWLKKAIQESIDRAYMQGKHDGWLEGHRQACELHEKQRQEIWEIRNEK